MAKRGWVDDRDLPGDSDERRDFALNLKEGLTPSGVFEDWGDYERDYPSESSLDDTTADNRDEGGLGFSSAEEVQAYYDQCNSADVDIQILRQDDD